MIVTKSSVPVWVEGKQAYMELANVRPDGVVLSKTFWAVIRVDGVDDALIEFEVGGDDLYCAVRNAFNTNTPLPNENQNTFTLFN